MGSETLTETHFTLPATNTVKTLSCNEESKYLHKSATRLFLCTVIDVRIPI